MISRSKIRILSASAIALTLSLTAQVPASAQAQQRGVLHSQQQRVLPSRQPQNLFEAIFPGLIQQRIARERVIEPPAPVEQVSAPKYYTYAPVKLVTIDLSPLVPATKSVDEKPAAAEPAAFENGENNPVTTGSVEMPDQAKAAYERIAQHFLSLSLMAEPEVAKALVEHYKTAQRLMWLNDNLEPNTRAKAVLPVFQLCEVYGLDPADYDVGMLISADPQDAARFEIAMTARAIRYAMDAKAGRVNPNKLSGYHDFPEGRTSASAVMKEIAESANPARTLAKFNPNNAQFLALKRELAGLETERGDIMVIPATTLIKPGDTHAEVPNVLAAIARKGTAETAMRAKAILDAAEPVTSFTPEVVEIVKAFQKEQALGADGVVGPNTVAKLSDIDPQTKRDQVIFAMERLRWLPRELGARRVFINQPAFTVRYVNGNKTALEMRVVVGKPSNQTSFFYDEIETVEYNPYWGIPRSILVNEYLPKLRANPAYLDERGYEVTDRSGRQIPSAAIDWNQVGSNPEFDVRQKPGDDNALGELKILFPNKHAIYMHDTPARNLFERSSRAFSHGCVRLQHPRQMAAAVLGKDVDYIASRIAGGEHSTDELLVHIPVYVAYFTAWPKDDGTVEYFADMYGRDSHLKKALEATRSSRAVAS